MRHQIPGDRLWENAWAEFVPFLQFDAEIRRIVCTTNAIESVNARIHKAVRARTLPRRGRRAEVRLHGRHEPEPHRRRTQTLDHAMEARTPGLRHRLRRPALHRPPLTHTAPEWLGRPYVQQGHTVMPGPGARSPLRGHEIPASRRCQAASIGQQKPPAESRSRVPCGPHPR